MPRIEEHIRRAIEEGDFENLPGKGQPLRLKENPLEDPEWRLANHVLESNGFTLPWIETRREIQSEIESVRHTLARAWKFYQPSRGADLHEELRESEWKRSQEAFSMQVDLLNRKIAEYNLQAPSLRFHLGKLDTEKEIRSVVKEIGEDRK
jgi:DnaJ homolog subfamily C member 28